jgi:outer membrane autotransporter protein
MQGATLFNTFALYTETNNLYAAYDHSAANPRAKVLPESFLGGLTLLNQGADIVAGPGMAEASSAARRAAQANSGRGYGLVTFSSISAGQSRYHTGSHVDVNSVSLLNGLAAGFEATPGFLTLGAFFEVGYGDYDTYNSFANAASVRGNGEAYHMGGGVLARLDFTKTGPGSFYLEASGRAGGIHNEYASGDLQDYQGRATSYDTHSRYYGLHAGGGYVWNLNDVASLDLYGKYFWTRQDGSSLTLSTNDPLHFSAVDSHRLRGGARFAYAINEHINPYLGLAYEHEFDGQAKASTYGYAIQSPNLRGDTGIGELGFSLKPSPDLPISFDLGGQVYTGKREGLAGILQMKYEF